MTQMMHDPRFVSGFLIGLVVLLMALYLGVRILTARVESGERAVTTRPSESDRSGKLD